MAKQIIVLETNPEDGGFNDMKVVFWFAVPANRLVPQPQITFSAWDGATAAEIQAIKDGLVYEDVQHIRVPSSYTPTELKAVLNKAYTDRAAFLGALPFKYQYKGIYFDSMTGWSA